MIKEALIKKLEGDVEVAKTDLRTFLANPIGVAEHIDYVVTAEKKLAHTTLLGAPLPVAPDVTLTNNYPQ